MRFCLLPLLVLLVLPCRAFGQEENPLALPEVVVLTTEAERVAPANNITIGRETIKSSSAVTLNDLLIEQGITVLQGPTPYENTTTSIRGFATGLHDSEANAHLLFLINGRRSGVTNARQLALNNVERIEIIRGPEMYKYAGSSPGGVVNIITKRGGPEPFGGSLEMGYGSYENYKGTVNLNGLVRNFDYSVGYSYQTIDHDYKDGRGKTVSSSSTNAINSFNGNVGYTFLDKHRIGVEYYLYDVDKAHKPFYYNVEEGKIEDPAIAYRSTYMLHLTYEGATDDDRFFWNASAGISRDAYKTIPDPDAEVHNMGQRVKTKQAKASLGYKGDLLDITGGADFIEYKTWNSGSPKPQFGYPIGAPMHLGHTTRDLGIFLVSTLKLFNEKVNITGGLRYDYYSMSDKCIGDEPFFENRKGNWYNDFKENGSRPTKREFKHLSPALGITYLPWEWLKLRANYTQTYRAPSGRQLFSSDATEGYGAPGDPRLSAELTDTYEGGFDIYLKHFNFSATYFYNKMRNHITIRGIQDTAWGIGPSAQNADDRRQAGFEFSTSLNLASAFGYDNFELRPYASMTVMTERKEMMLRGYEGKPNSYAGEWMFITGVPKRTMSYGVRFHHYDWKLMANLNINYFGKTWGGQNPTFIRPQNYVKYGDFTIVNFSMRKELWAFDDKRNLEVKFQVNNLFNERYAYAVDPPTSNPYMPGRNMYVGLVFNF